MRAPKLGTLRYECPRCGDTYECATQDDLVLVTTHRLLHFSGDWKQSFLPPAYWALDEEEATKPVAASTR